MVYLKFQYDLELRNCGKIEGCFFQVAGQTAHLSSGRLRRLQVPATNDNCETSADPVAEVFAFVPPFRSDRLLRPPATIDNF